MEDELARCKARLLSDAPLDWSQFRVLRPPPFLKFRFESIITAISKFIEIY